MWLLRLLDQSLNQLIFFCTLLKKLIVLPSISMSVIWPRYCIKKKLCFPKKFEIVNTLKRNEINRGCGFDGGGNGGGCDGDYDGGGDGSGGIGAMVLMVVVVIAMVVVTMVMVVIVEVVMVVMVELVVVLV